MIDEIFSRAVVAYVGPVGAFDSRSPEARVAEAVGGLESAVIARIRAMLSDLHAAEPPLWDSPEIARVADNAVAWLATEHPELSSAAVRAIANRFAYEWQ
jgi:hypothetical protein